MTDQLNENNLDSDALSIEESADSIIRDTSSEVDECLVKTEMAEACYQLGFEAEMRGEKNEAKRLFNLAAKAGVELADIHLVHMAREEEASSE